MVSLECVATELPPYRYTKDDILGVGSSWLAGRSNERTLFERFVSSSRVEYRHFALPLEEVTSLGGASERAAVFEREAAVLGKKALRSCLERAGRSPSEIDALIFTSCSVPLIPSVDVSLVHELGFSPNIVRVPLYQQGCAGGAAGLSLAGTMSLGGKAVLLLSVELCSLVYHADDYSGASLLGAALFGDGAACALVEPKERGFVLIGAQSHLIPNSSHLMGYDVFDDGSRLRLGKELPSCLASVSPEVISNFLQSYGLSVGDIAWWLFHPGGVKVLQILEDALGLNPTQSRWAWEVLTQCGNMSSASILFVLSEFMRSGESKEGDYALVFGVGPGLTVELLLFQSKK